MSAALVEILGLTDLRRAVKLLDRDLEVREYQTEVRGNFGSPTHQQYSDDMAKLSKIDKLMDELGIPAPRSET